MTRKILTFALLTLLTLFNSAQADAVKPALIEISANKNGEVSIEIRASIEALLTGINGKYKNTQDAPNADKYDELRKLSNKLLSVEFDKFRTTFLDKIYLKDDQERKIVLQISEVDIPEPGYTKVPRISLIKLHGELEKTAKQVQWYYPLQFGDNAVRLKQVDSEKSAWHWSEWQWIREDKASEPFSLTEIFTQSPIHTVIFEYISIGFGHILPAGVDHILFILGIFLLNAQLKPLVQQVTLFTIAHTITLGLSSVGIINLPANIVEPLIALSIAYVGIENLFAHQLHKTRLIIVFLFGLIHGMGLASALSDFNMPEDTFLTSLLSFNVGVELGQLALIIMALIAVTPWLKNENKYRKMIVIPGSLIISAIGVYWTLERLNLIA